MYLVFPSFDSGTSGWGNVRTTKIEKSLYRIHITLFLPTINLHFPYVQIHTIPGQGQRLEADSKFEEDDLGNKVRRNKQNGR